MTFYFYDLETSGISPKSQRIMQFAGQRTDENFNPLGEPQNWLVKLTEEVLPDPDAIVLTGITPQKTIEEGYTEAEFLQLFHQHVAQPDTTIVGFNNIRFDDEFMRYTLWRNFYDPYSWQWADGCGRWDLLDVVRMVRALRPEGIQWPVNDEGRPTNRLEQLTALNGLNHEAAHDALSDVHATIAMARLLRQKQPKMVEYFLKNSNKKSLTELTVPGASQPFIYTSGRYSNNWQKTTAVVSIAPALHGNVLVYDLRQDPHELAKLSEDELKAAAFSRHEITEIVPVKAVRLNCCPAVAPLGVLDAGSQKRLNLPLTTIKKNYAALRSIPGLIERLQKLYEQVEGEWLSKFAQEATKDPDFQLYDGFINEDDKTVMRAVRAADKDTISKVSVIFKDQRLNKLLSRYIARNYPGRLSSEQRANWDEYRTRRFIEGVPGQLSFNQFMERIRELAAIKTDEPSQFVLQELQLYAESIAPISDS
jgi:exodeoxyribonuclease I